MVRDGTCFTVIYDAVLADAFQMGHFSRPSFTHCRRPGDAASRHREAKREAKVGSENTFLSQDRIICMLYRSDCAGQKMLPRI